MIAQESTIVHRINGENGVLRQARLYSGFFTKRENNYALEKSLIFSLTEFLEIYWCMEVNIIQIFCSA